MNHIKFCESNLARIRVCVCGPNLLPPLRPRPVMSTRSPERAPVQMKLLLFPGCEIPEGLGLGEDNLWGSSV